MTFPSFICFSNTSILSIIIINFSSTSWIPPQLWQNKTKTKTNKQTVGEGKWFSEELTLGGYFDLFFLRSNNFRGTIILLITQSVQGLKSGWTYPGRAGGTFHGPEMIINFGWFLCLLKCALDQCTSNGSKRSGGEGEETIENIQTGMQSGSVHTF